MYTVLLPRCTALKHNTILIPVAMTANCTAFASAAPLLLRGTARHSLHRTPLSRRPFFVSPSRIDMGLGDVLNRVFGSAGGTAVEPGKHAVLGTPIALPDLAVAPLQTATFGLGCFWGAERKFWKTTGVYSTSVGYAAGATENPTYSEVCSGRTGHAEVVNVVFDSTKTSYDKLLDVFWEAHDPTTKNRQGNDVGTQYRSIIMYYSEEQKKAAEETKEHFNTLLKEKGYGPVVTEIEPAKTYYLAEDYHQQYLQKNPGGYCGLGGTGAYVPPVRAQVE